MFCEKPADKYICPMLIYVNRYQEKDFRLQKQHIKAKNTTPSKQRIQKIQMDEGLWELMNNMPLPKKQDLLRGFPY